MNLELEGKVVLVGGASRGIGRATAAAFAEEGARLALIGRDADSLEVACSELGALPLQADMRDPAQVTAAVRRTVAELGRLDVAIANAGSGRGPREDAVGAEAWDGMLAQNLMTVVHLFEAAPAAIRSDGALVAVGSIAGLEHHAAPLPYSTAKAAMIRYVRDLARRLASRRIRVNLVAPGNVLFPGGSWDQRVRDDPDGTEAFIAREVPMARFGLPEEVASAIVFLSSARSSFTTGGVLVVDGGQLRA